MFFCRYDTTLVERLRVVSEFGKMHQRRNLKINVGKSKVKSGRISEEQKLLRGRLRK